MEPCVSFFCNTVFLTSSFFNQSYMSHGRWTKIPPSFLPTGYRGSSCPVGSFTVGKWNWRRRNNSFLFNENMARGIRGTQAGQTRILLIRGGGGVAIYWEVPNIGIYTHTQKTFWMSSSLSSLEYCCDRVCAQPEFIYISWRLYIFIIYFQQKISSKGQIMQQGSKSFSASMDGKEYFL
jgi:hypothetical protein